MSFIILQFLAVLRGLFGTTANKTVETTTVTGLMPCTEYFFILRTVTYSHPDNQNTVYSEYTDEVSAKTSDDLTDTDGDGTTNCNDTDDDNDGILDEEETLPLDDTEAFDTDEDGTGDNAEY